MFTHEFGLVLKSSEEKDSDQSSYEEEEEDELVDPIVSFLDSLRLSEYAPLFQVKIISLFVNRQCHYRMP